MGAIGSLFGSNSNNVPTSTYQPVNQVGADTGAFNQTNQMSTTLQSLLSQYLPQLGIQTGANTAGGVAGTQAANTVAGPGQAVGQGSVQGAANLQGGAESLIPYATSALNTAFDPQAALYSKLYQQNQDQANVQNNMAGVGSTPYGAGVADMSGQNFNMNWLNTLLNRESTGANTANTLLSGADSLFGGAQNLATAGQTGAVSSAMLPFATTSAAAGANTGALTQGIGATTGASQPSIADLLQYLGIGNQAISNYNSGQIGGTNATTNQMNAGWGELGNLANVGGAFLGF